MTYSTQTKFSEWYFSLAAIIAITLLICALVVDNSGRKDWNHPQPISAGMTQLTKSAYLIDSHVGIEASDICKGSSGSDSSAPDFQSVNVPRLHSVFVQCGRSQTWNDKRGLSPNFGEGIMRTLQNPAWVIPMGGLFLVFSIVPWSTLISEKRKERLARKSRRLVANQKRELLTTQWAQDKITDLEFENKLDQIEREAL